MDELLPNDGSSFYVPEVPESQIKDEQAERAKILGGAKLLEEIIERFRDRIAAYDSVDSIQHDPKTNTQDFMNAWNVNRGTKDQLTQEMEYLIGLRDTYKKK